MFPNFLFGKREKKNNGRLTNRKVYVKLNLTPGRDEEVNVNFGFK